MDREVGLGARVARPRRRLGGCRRGRCAGVARRAPRRVRRPLVRGSVLSPGRELNVAIIATPTGRAAAGRRDRFEGVSAREARDRRLRGEVARRQLRVPQHGARVRRGVRARGARERLALACWELFALDGYARVDFRVDSCRHAVGARGQRESLPVARRRFRGRARRRPASLSRRRRLVARTMRGGVRERGEPRVTPRAPVRYRSRPTAPTCRRCAGSLRRPACSTARACDRARAARGASRGRREERLFVLLRRARRRARRLLHLGRGAADAGELRPVLDRRCAGWQGWASGRELMQLAESRGRPRRRRPVHRDLVARRLRSHPAVLSPGGLKQVASLRDFYAPGDHKIVFCKVIPAVPSRPNAADGRPRQTRANPKEIL